jgi:hypothetical protein
VARRKLVLAAWMLTAAGLISAAGDTHPAPPAVAVKTPSPATPVAPPPVRIPRAAAAPRGLPVIDYWSPPRGFPGDPAPRSTTPITEGLRPTRSLVLYDSPGGKPKARLKPSISGLPVTVPIVAHRTGWYAVLLPSVNRKIGWLPAGGWTAHPLADHLVVHRRANLLTWLRDGVTAGTWRVATGTTWTPTPLGRTFVLGRTTTAGAVYAGLDALVLGSVPDDPRTMAPALRKGHTAFHTWYRTNVFGRSVSNGCIRVPRVGQRALLDHIAPGTPVTVVD